MSNLYRGPEDYLDPVQQQELLQKIGVELVDAAPYGWKEITFTAEPLTMVTESGMWITGEDGESKLVRHPNEITENAISLRHGMYRDGVGTWFSMTLHIIRPGKFKVDFNYDDQPNYSLPPSPQDFATDLKYNPRNPENIPDWLQEKLRQAESREDGEE